MKRREFITLLGGAAARGRSRRARKNACGASAYSQTPVPTTPRCRVALRRLCRACRSWAGRLVEICRSTTAGATAMPNVFAPMPQN